MLGAVALIVGAVVAWIAADQLLLWWRERRPDGPSSWHGNGPGKTFHSTGFEDTVPPHEALERRPPGRGRPTHGPVARH
jgi:hypothetical protein